MPHLQQGAKVLDKNTLETGVQVAQDVCLMEIKSTQRLQSAVEKLLVDKYLRLGVVEELQKEKCRFVVYLQTRNEKQ